MTTFCVQISWVVLSKWESSPPKSTVFSVGAGSTPQLLPRPCLQWPCLAARGHRESCGLGRAEEWVQGSGVCPTWGILVGKSWGGAGGSAVFAGVMQFSIRKGSRGLLVGEGLITTADVQPDLPLGASQFTNGSCTSNTCSQRMIRW